MSTQASTAPDDDLAVPAPIRAAFMQQRAVRIAHEQISREYEEGVYAAIHAPRVSGQMAAIMASARAVLRLTPELKQFLGVTSAATIAWYARQGDKTHRKHWKKANECFRVIADAKTRLTHIGFGESTDGIYQLVFRARDWTLVYVAIKFVPKGRGGAPEDECWVRTVHATDPSEVRRQMKRGELRRAFRTRYSLGDLRAPP